MNAAVFRQQLAIAAVPECFWDSLATYFDLLCRWNSRMNLSGLDVTRDPTRAVERLILEPMSAATHMKPKIGHMMDIGSGGGSPAIPLAIAAPDAHLTMVESRSRKSMFLKEAVRELRLDADVLTTRFEDLSSSHLTGSQGLVSVRAVRLSVANVEQLVRFLAPGGEVFMLRGRERSPALDAIVGVQIRTVSLQVGLQNHIDIVGRQAP